MSDGSIIFIHSSDELYGADRILLDLHSALPVGWRSRSEFWLPTDVAHPADSLCRELERRGATVRHLDLPVLRRSYRSPRQLSALARRTIALYGRLRKARPQLVYCTTSATFLAAPVARMARVPRVVGHVQELWSRGDRRVLGPLALFLHHVVAIAGAVAAALPAALRGRTTVVLNATPDPGDFSHVSPRSGPLRFLVASRWNGWKGHRTLLRAWDAHDGAGELVILGEPPATGDAVDVSALVALLQVPGSVRLVGQVPSIDRYVQDADVLVVPSDSPEPFGLVAVEAFARGRPVIGSNGGGLAEIITDGVDGWLYPLGDAEALRKILDNLTREQVVVAGRNARATYERRFTSTRYASEWRAAIAPPRARSTAEARDLH